MFKPAVRKKSKLRLALTGPSGCGKTYSALLLSLGLGCERVALLDTENSSASLYTHLRAFDTVDLHAPYTPERYVEIIHAAAAQGYECLILDSITPEWVGVGGCIESNDLLAQARYKGNSWAAWSETTPRHKKFIDALQTAPLHIIATIRSKTDTVQSENRKVIKLGMKLEQREGIEFEFTTVLDLQHDTHLAVPSKDRTQLFGAHTAAPITVATGELLREWLETGLDAAAALLTTLEQAATLGSPALVQAHKDHQKSVELQGVWAAHGARLKTMAKAADAQYMSADSASNTPKEGATS